MAVFAVKLEPNYSAQEIQAAVLNICTQAWGAPIYRQPASGYPYGHRYIEWPDFFGRKHYWYTQDSNGIAPGIASGRLEPNYQNTVQGANSIFVNPSNKSLAVYLMAFVGPTYRAFSWCNSSFQYAHAVGQMQYPVAWWGDADRVYYTGDRASMTTIPGLNPFGKLNAQGNANPAGRTGYPIDQRNVTFGPNSLTGKREVRKNDHVMDDTDGIVGFFPEDFGIAASQGISAAAPVIYDAGEGGLYTSLNTFNYTGWCLKVDAPPLPDLVSYPAAVYDLINPSGSGGGETIVKPHPAQLALKGQIHPSPFALPAPGTPKP